MLTDLMRNGFTIDMVINLCARVFVIFCVLPIHEFAHALIAHLLGDDTARLKGRMTTNPLAHIDPMGALMILLVGFGYAKPVPINIRNFKNRKRDMALTALAGPVSNLIVAFILMLGYCGIYVYTMPSHDSAMGYLVLFLNYAFSVNISLAVFNFIPIPPLDGSRILTAFLPDKYYYKIMQYERQIVMVVFVLIIFGVLNYPMAVATRFISEIMFGAASAVFGV